ncbi:sigma-70 family RNA polymerase sigma factor [Prauserella muralis]|uniref:RNA polymerase subunit sigma n=1 Tax=Prauserella muralis TaxID=588067 RepID=A0A2V4BAQ0_9PSEU|nr:sigma-70 family RNA polymerase sigma factor [Prauserella muralis]PXY32368.1 RNA polymerase subunit sigma [Prauserella muralis]TWE23947.1 RNA polymerase sigma factor (sigma-70 family) [Prauserella muralis]
MTTASADPSGMSDAELISAVREGRLAAYGTLYERHVSAAYNLARQLARSSTEADDLVSEAFSKVLDTLRAGKGPDSAFRAYLLTALRHTAYDKTRKDKRVDLAEDMTDMATAGSAAAEALTVPFSDTAMAGLERTLAAKAFARLPERWQAVLWHTEIEQQSPAEVAPLLGLTANGVSALAYRAREGLRQAYLQVHLAETSASRCRATADKLGAWTRDGLSKRERAQVEQHLDECADCRALAAELADVNGALRAVVAPLVLGGGVLGYLALAGAGKASAATAVGAGAAAGSAGGAAGAAASGPRQFVGVATSGVAMAAAVALALTAGGGSPEIPRAAVQPPPAAEAPANPPAPPANPPAPQPPAPQPQPVDPAPPPVVPPPPPPAAPPPADPEPAPPRVTAQAPPEGIELQPGGAPVDLPITVRNDGGRASDPVVVTLSLPEGVSAIGPASGGGGAPAGGLAARQAQAAERVTCPGGTGTVSCRTQEGLEPGESAVLTFRLQAAEGARSGEVTGTISSGSPVEVSLRVPVSVPPPPPPPPPPRDDVYLDAKAGFGPWAPWTRTVAVFVRNDGESTKPATITLSQRASVVVPDPAVRCEPGAKPAACTTTPLEPGEDVSVVFFVHSHHWREQPTTVTATLGADSESETVELCWFGHHCHLRDKPEPTPESPSDAPPTESSPSEERPSTRTPASEPSGGGAPTTPARPVVPTTPATESSKPPEPSSTPSARPSSPAPSSPARPAPAESGKPYLPPLDPDPAPGRQSRGLWDWLPWPG